MAIKPKLQPKKTNPSRRAKLQGHVRLLKLPNARNRIITKIKNQSPKVLIRLLRIKIKRAINRKTIQINVGKVVHAQIRVQIKSRIQERIENKTKVVAITAPTIDLNHSSDPQVVRIAKIDKSVRNQKSAKTFTTSTVILPPKVF